MVQQYIYRSVHAFYAHSIFRETSHYADILAKLGLSLTHFIWWNNPPLDIRKDLVLNRLGMPNFRFT